jgi:hypothetical protein
MNKKSNWYKKNRKKFKSNNNKYKKEIKYKCNKIIIILINKMKIIKSDNLSLMIQS